MRIFDRVARIQYAVKLFTLRRIQMDVVAVSCGYSDNIPADKGHERRFRQQRCVLRLKF